MLIWYLENGYFDEAVVWRLGVNDPIIFDINGKKLIQRWVKDFRECKNYGTCDISFFRGGFKEYDSLVENYSGLGKKLYLGAGQRVYPQKKDIYDMVLVEDETDISRDVMSAPFFKTANPVIFNPLNMSRKAYDLCYIANFTQFKYKGQESFLKAISASKYLRSLSIVHLGNKPIEGQKICKKYNIKNIDFLGWKERDEVNRIINNSKIGLVNSNTKDGCPRVITEMLSTGIPLLINSKTRCLDYYKEFGVIEFMEKGIKSCIKEVLMYDYDNLKEKAKRNITEKLPMDIICRKNYEVWNGNVIWK